MMNEPEERGRRGAKRHTVHMESRERATVSGVNELDSFNEDEIILVTDDSTLTITGEGLHIDKLNLDDGQLIISGLLYSFEYEDDVPTTGGGGFFGRLLGR